MQTPRIALIHATALAIEPINSAFERHWPQAQRMNLLDDSLSVDLQSVCVPGAMEDLAQGRTADHHHKVAQAARTLSSCDAVMLAQFSMAAARDEAQRELPCPVLSSPDCAVLALRKGMTNA